MHATNSSVTISEMGSEGLINMIIMMLSSMIRLEVASAGSSCRYLYPSKHHLVSNWTSSY